MDKTEKKYYKKDIKYFNFEISNSELDTLQNIKNILNNIEYIESKGFQIKGRYILKRSQSDNRQKVVGQLNESNFFFFSENVYPFKSGTNYFDNSTLVDPNYIHYVKESKQSESTDFDVSFEQYFEVTKQDSVFTNWLNETTKKLLNKDSENYFDLRGVYSGYMENAVCFPFIDFDGNFVTAQIIKYDSKGSRIKSQFSQNWFHSYKNIKTSLELESKYSVPVKCFFGENYLKDSSNIVAIVEAPKTASILKEVYPNIDWLATAGESQISNKDLSVLEDRTVVLFPDAHTTKWTEFAAENNFYCSNILDVEDVHQGEDIADHIFDDTSTIYSKLHDQLQAVSEGIIDSVDSLNELEFNFKVVGEAQDYFTIVNPNYKGKNVLLSIDNAKDFEVSFTDKLFAIYKKEQCEAEGNLQGYEVYSSQIDWHRPVVENGGFRQMNEQEFVFTLQGCFRILKELNPKIYLDVFRLSLDRFKESNYSFNKDYVLASLVPKWDNHSRDLSVFKKVRDWKFLGKQSLTRKEFIKELHNSRYRANLSIKANAFNDVLGKNRFIDIETDLLIKSNYNTFKKLTNLAKEWNEFVIGAKTYKSYVSKEKVTRCTKNAAVHISSYIYTASKNVQSNFNYSKIAEITGIKNRNTIKSFLEFEPNMQIAERIKNDIFFIIENIRDAEPVRQLIGRKGIIDFDIKIADLKDSSVFSQALGLKDAFITLKQAKNLLKRNKKQYNPKQLQALEDEINYLEFLEMLSDIPTKKRGEIMNDQSQRNQLIEKGAKAPVELEVKINTVVPLMVSNY